MVSRHDQNNQSSLIDQIQAQTDPQMWESFAAGVENYRFERSLDPRYQALRRWAEKVGPPSGVIASENEVANVQAMVAAGSVQGGWAVNLGLCFIYKNKLVEMISSGCPEHPDGADCDACCLVLPELVPLRSWKAIRDFFRRHDIARYSMDELDYDWSKVPVPDQAIIDAADINCWPGTRILKGFAPLPLIHHDEFVQTEPGIEGTCQFWAVPRGVLSHAALPTSDLADQLAELAGFRGSMSDMAAELNRRYGSKWSAKGLQCAIRRDRDKLELRGVIAESTGGSIGPTGRAEWIVESNGKNGKNALTSGNAFTFGSNALNGTSTLRPGSPG